MSVYHSRHTRYSQKAVPRKKRSIQLYGEGGYRNTLWKCWNCGMINKSSDAYSEHCGTVEAAGRISQVADTFEGGDKWAIEEFYEDTNITTWGMQDPRYLMLTVDFGLSINLPQLDSAGNPMQPDVSAYVVITQGCVFCGSLNFH